MPPTKASPTKAPTLSELKRLANRAEKTIIPNLQAFIDDVRAMEKEEPQRTRQTTRRTVR